LVGAGYGEYHPIAANTTAEGMAQNRRVSIVVVAPSDDQDIQHTPVIGAAAPPAGATPIPAPAAAAPSPPAAVCGAGGLDAQRC
jgi:chemotaxis protein MotB